MKFVLLLVTLCVAAASARPRYIAIPLDGTVELVEFEGLDAGPELVRVVRDAGDDAGDDAARIERQAHHGGGGGGDGHDHVDYGAHTGHHGAFGWYADFPVHKGH